MGLPPYNLSVSPPRDPRFRAACHVRVRYAETDAMGVVYYANYLAFFESARIEYIRAIGCSYRDMEATGVVAAVTEAHCKYLAPARFDDLLTIYVRIERLRKASMTFAYEVWREEDGVLLSEGTTAHACLNRETLRPAPLPLEFREATIAFEGPEVAQ
jgi:acyl-CoA thioester hydrolase